jgi:hypothetical protein
MRRSRIGKPQGRDTQAPFREEPDMNRYGWLLACALVLDVSSGYARTWTDNRGQKLEGEFIRVLKGKVVLSANGRITQVPFGQLIDEDQEIVRTTLEARGQGSFLPPRKKGAKPDSSNTEPATGVNSTAGRERTWTDVAGRKVQARFLDFENGNVVLQLRGKRSSIAFDRFSDEDQKFVMREMENRGQGGKVSAMAATVSPPATPTVTPQPEQQIVRSFPPPQPVVIPRTTFPQFKVPEFKPPVIVPTPVPTLPPMPTQPPLPSFSQPTVPSSSPLPTPSTSPFSSPFAAGKVCSSCKKVVPSTCTAGDNCPFCGVYFEYEDQGFGVKKHAPFSWKTFTTSGGIALLVAIAAVIIRMCRSN